MFRIHFAILFFACNCASASGFGRIDFAERIARNCMVKSLESESNLQNLAALGFSAHQFCECLGERTAAGLSEAEIQYLRQHDGQLPAWLADKPMSRFVESCLSAAK